MGVIWGGYTLPQNRTQEQHLVDRLFYSTFTRGSWSRPSLVVADTTGIEWTDDVAVPFAAEPGGTEELVFSYSKPVGASLGHVTLKAGSVTLEHPGGRSVPLALYPASNRRGQSVIIAYVALATDATHPADVNSVWVIRSGDGGAQWSSPALVSRSGDKPASQLRLLSARDGTVHLLFARGTNGNIFASELWHAYSTDAGVHWVFMPALHAGRDVHDVTAVVDACGTVHVTYTTATGELLYTTADRGGWSIPQRIATTGFAVTPKLFIDPDGNLRVFWNRFQAPIASAPPVLVQSLRRRLK